MLKVICEPAAGRTRPYVCVRVSVCLCVMLPGRHALLVSASPASVSRLHLPGEPAPPGREGAHP